MSIPCGEDIPSILELQLRKSVEMTQRPELPSERRAREEAETVEAVDDALPRLRALLADTKSLVARMDAIVASMKDPANHFRRY